MPQWAVLWLHGLQQLHALRRWELYWRHWRHLVHALWRGHSSGGGGKHIVHCMPSGQLCRHDGALHVHLLRRWLHHQLHGLHLCSSLLAPHCHSHRHPHNLSGGLPLKYKLKCSERQPNPEPHS